MLKNYFKIAYRNLLKNKVFSLINILGLAIGMAACLLIFQYVSFELSYDDFHEKGKRIYRLRMDRYVNNEFKFRSAKTYPAIGPRLKQDFPEVLDYTRLLPDHGILAYEPINRRFYEDKVFLADATFFKLFSFSLLEGDTANVLQDPNTMVISTSTAQKYFGNQQALGKLLNFYKDDGTQETYKVTGVFKDIPPNSHLDFDILMSYQTLLQRYGNNNSNWKPSEDSWEVDEYYTYILLNQNASPDNLEEKLPAFFRKYKGEIFEARNVKEVLYLQPLLDIHLFSNLRFEAGITGNSRFIYLLSLVAIFIMAIVWINYINLTTAKATERAKEIGIRKVLGSKWSQLLKQFLLETILINLVALVLAITIAQFALPYFQIFLGHTILVDFWKKVELIGVLSGLFIVGVLISSFYPAIVLSGFQTLTVLKGKITGQKNGILLRKGLVILQFATTIIMMAGLLIVHQQINYMKNQDLGFDVEQMVIVKAASYLKDAGENEYESKSVVFKEKLLQYPQINNVTESGFIPGQEIKWRQGLVRRVHSESDDINTYHVFAVDERFFATYDLKPIAGKVSSEVFTLTGAVIINEAAAKQLGFTDAEKAIGEEIYVELDGEDKGQIVGVIKDYHHLSLENDFLPQIFFYRSATWSFFSIKVAEKNVHEGINIIRKEFEAVFPDNPFEYYFLDQFFDEQYKSDQKFSAMFSMFTLLSVFLACLGLFGLSSYTILQRTKEIGIRKILGASVKSVVTLLSRDFIKLVSIASIIALPVAYFAMQRWLENYAFRIEISWWLLTTPVIIVLFIAIITVSFQTIKAAVTNPVESLRYE